VGGAAVQKAALPGKQERPGVPGLHLQHGRRHGAVGVNGVGGRLGPIPKFQKIPKHSRREEAVWVRLMEGEWTPLPSSPSITSKPEIAELLKSKTLKKTVSK